MQDLLPIRTIIKAHSVLAKKNLGQNFLVDDSVFTLISRNIAHLSNSNILEVGPGIGSLSRILVSTGAKKIIAVERDESFAPYLDQLSDKYKNYEYLFSDAMIIEENKLFDENFSIVANLPYNIATELLYKWLDINCNIDYMYLMFQKEVAERIVAKPNTKHYGKLSIMLQLVADAEILFDIEPKSFIPAPKVTSSFVKIKMNHLQQEIVDKKKLNTLLSHMFNFRRKMIRQTLKHFHPNPEELLSKLNIIPSQRPEELTIQQFCELANSI